MKLFHIGKDGGPESTVTGFWLVEWKKVFSVALLRFGDGSREKLHDHAFNCISWVLRGRLREEHLDGRVMKYEPSLKPVITKRSTFHRVFSEGTTWVFTLRGPWSKQWHEYDPATGIYTDLENGRVEVGSHR